MFIIAKYPLKVMEIDVSVKTSSKTSYIWNFVSSKDLY